jgi:hypothetical protein
LGTITWPNEQDFSPETIEIIMERPNNIARWGIRGDSRSQRQKNHRVRKRIRGLFCWFGVLVIKVSTVHYF